MIVNYEILNFRLQKATLGKQQEEQLSGFSVPSGRREEAAATCVLINCNHRKAEDNPINLSINSPLKSA